MSKVNLIIGREYWTRVKTKTFLLTTFLAPIAIALFYAVLIFFMTRGSDKTKNITIIDKAGLAEKIEMKKNNLVFDLSNESLVQLKEKYKAGDIDGIIELPPLDSTQDKYNIVYHADKALALDESSAIEKMFSKPIRDYKMTAFGFEQSQLDKIDTDIEISPQTVNETEKELSSITGLVSSGVGFIVGTVLFFVIMIFGSQVMRGVNEEKLNRIVEVLISSVKPIQLMLGKVIGIGLVGLTQFGIWAILGSVISIGALAFFGLDAGMADPAANEMAAEAMANPEIKSKMAEILKELSTINWGLIIPLYFVYFLLGYMMYASVFAAVGAAAGDDVNEAQALTTVVMVPLAAAFYIAISAAQSPDSTLAVWSSIIPISAPVVMPVRLASGPPAWEIILSVVLCALFVVFMIWLASRIYRVGIMMYGKKASFKELAKWIAYRD